MNLSMDDFELFFVPLELVKCNKTVRFFKVQLTRCDCVSSTGKLGSCLD